MAIFRGTGGAGDSTTDATVTEVTQQAVNAAQSASEAASSASAAATSRDFAATYASQASGSATLANTFSNTAADYRTEAAGYKNQALTSATNAATSETNASTSATSAATSATNAASSASAASTSETNASTSATAAATSETNAASSATTASTAATSASTSAATATTRAIEAAGSASSASTSATAAQTAQAAAEAAQEAIDGLYLGALASNPTVDGNGDPVTTGDWYFNTTSNNAYIYNGSTWDALAPDLIGDTTPQLGGDLDLNSSDITGTGNINITGNVSLTGTVDGRDIATDGTKLDGIEASADVTDTANVTAAGALMDSEVTNLAQVKAFDSADYATAAQGLTADSALQNVVEDTTPQLGGNLDLNSNNITGTGNIDVTGTVTADVLDVSSGTAGASKTLGSFSHGQSGSVGAASRIALGLNNTSRYAYIEAETTDGGNAHELNFATNSASASPLERLTIAGNGDISFYEDTGTTAKFFWDASAESLGIGTSSPQTPLVISNSGAQGLEIDGYNTSASATLLQAYNRSASAFNAMELRASQLEFNIGSSEAMRVDGSGRLLVGGTSAVNSGSKIEAQATSGDCFIHTNSGSLADGKQALLLATSTSRSAGLAVYKHSGITNPASYLQLSEEDGNNQYFWVDNSGNFRISTNASHVGTTSGTVVGTQTSDERLKVIEPEFTYGLDAVINLQPIAYTRNDEENSPRRLGFGAQSTFNVVPEAVYDTQECLDGYDQCPDDPMVQTPKSENTKLAMEYVQLIPVLTKAIQEQQEQINELKAEVAALKGA